MAETVEKKEKRKKTYPELLDALGKTLLYQGELEDELEDLYAQKAEQRKIVRAARWFSEDRYRKKAKYWTIKANIVEVRKLIKGNIRLIEKLETAVKNCHERRKPEPEKPVAPSKPADDKPLTLKRVLFFNVYLDLTLR